MKRGAEHGGDFVVEPLGENVLLLRFGSRIDTALNACVHEASAMLRAAHLPGIVDVIPAYATLALHYDALQWTEGNGGLPWQHVAAAVRAIFRSPPIDVAPTLAIVEIPVCYGGEFGPDLDALAHRAGLDIADAVSRHTAPEYRVAMLGFAPGFPYLLGLDPALHAPRRADPRTRVPAGSVAIGGAQTGVYSAETPGGWQLIGRTPVKPFDPARGEPFLMKAGDTVQFYPIEPAEFDRWK